MINNAKVVYTIEECYDYTPIIFIDETNNVVAINRSIRDEYKKQNEQLTFYLAMLRKREYRKWREKMKERRACIRDE